MSSTNSPSDRGYYILVTTDAYHISGRRVAAASVIKNRIEKGQWPIYRNTRNRRSFNEGDICAVYVGGKRTLAKHFVGYFTIEKIKSNRGYLSVDSQDLLNDPPVSILEFKEYKEFEKPLSIYDLLPKLDFIPKNRQKWGVVLMGGCRKISRKDFSELLKLEH